VNDEAAKIRLIMELRRQGIGDTRVLSALEMVPRELFMQATFQDRAYDNIALPIHQGQTISQPFVVAFMTQALAVGPRMKVLEIGTGSGYQAAVLSRLCRRVYTIERYRSLNREAEARFKALGVTNVVSKVGDGYDGWPEQAPFDRILVTAAAPEVPEKLIEQLRPSGLLVLPVGAEADHQDVLRITKAEDGSLKQDRLLPVRFVPLVPGVERRG